MGHQLGERDNRSGPYCQGRENPDSGFTEPRRPHQRRRDTPPRDPDATEKDPTYPRAGSNRMQDRLPPGHHHIPAGDQAQWVTREGTQTDRYHNVAGHGMRDHQSRIEPTAHRHQRII